MLTDEASLAVSAVRAKDAVEGCYVLLGFDDPKKCERLKVLAAGGTGGIEKLKEDVPEGDVAYGLVRAVLKFGAEGSASVNATKFVYAHWRPERIPLSRKMKIGILDGKIKKAMGAFHATIEAEEVGELSEDAVTALLEDIAGVKDRTGNKKATVAATGGFQLLQPPTKDSPAAAGVLRKTGTAADNLNVSSKGAACCFADEAELASTLKAVKDPEDTRDWAVWAYADIKTLVKVKDGTGGLPALLEAFPADAVAYGAFVVSETHDVSTASKGGIRTQKLCFLVWTPDTVGAVKKAKIATHAGVVKSAFRAHFPYAYDFHVSNRTELSEADVKRAIGKLTGTANSVLDDTDAAERRSSFEQKKKTSKENVDANTSLGGVQASSKAVRLDVDPAINAHIAKIRKDDAPDDFVVAYFDPQTQILLTGPVGPGGVQAAVDAIPLGKFAYCLIRLSEQIDASTVTRFLFVAVHDPSVPATVKGKLATLFGRVKQLFSPYHGSLTLDSPSDLTLELADATIRGDRAKNAPPGC